MFKSSYTIGKIFGIPVKIHISFLLVLPFFAWVLGNNIQYLTDNSGIKYANLVLNSYLLGLIMTLGLFLSVVLHELSHSLIARSKGIEIENITLMLFGGISHMEELTSEPGDEAQTAMAGPLLSIILGVLLLLLNSVLPKSFSADFRLVILYLGQINIFLAIFNLLPAFPTDGGRILRALIAQKTSLLKATKIATSVGKAFAFLFGIVGLLWGNFILLFIAFFVYIGASQEYHFNLFKETLSDLTVADLMTEEVSTVTGNISIQELIEKMFAERHSGYPVMEEEKVIGMVTMEDIQKSSPDRHQTTPVKQIMEQDIKEIKASDDIYKAFRLLFQKDIGRLLVMEEGKLVGIITRSDLLKGFRIKQLQNKF